MFDRQNQYYVTKGVQEALPYPIFLLAVNFTEGKRKWPNNGLLTDY